MSKLLYTILYVDITSKDYIDIHAHHMGKIVYHYIDLIDRISLIGK